MSPISRICHSPTEKECHIVRAKSISLSGLLEKPQVLLRAYNTTQKLGQQTEQTIHFIVIIRKGNKCLFAGGRGI